MALHHSADRNLDLSLINDPSGCKTVKENPSRGSNMICARVAFVYVMLLDILFTFSLFQGQRLCILYS